MSDSTKRGKQTSMPLDGVRQLPGWPLAKRPKGGWPKAPEPRPNWNHLGDCKCGFCIDERLGLGDS